MAKQSNKARQKLVFKLEPGQTKPRNLVAANAKQSGAGSHKKPPAALRRAEKQALKKLHADEDKA